MRRSTRIRSHLRGNIIGYVAMFFAISGTAAVASHPGGANTITTGDIVNEQVFTQDLANNNMTSLDIRDDTLGSGGLQAIDLRADSVGASEIAAGAVGFGELNPGAFFSGDISDDGGGGQYQVTTGGIDQSDIATNGVGSAEVDDGSLGSVDTNQFSAVVNSDATLARASVGGVTVAPSGTGNYVVDFGRDISACSFNATIGLAGQSGTEAPGFITVVGAAVAAGEGVFVTTDDIAGASANRGFHLQVSCD